ncbi:MAG: hypothetical protein ABFR75_11075 [Acidobacteriota bacterium]
MKKKSFFLYPVIPVLFLIFYLLSFEPVSVSAGSSNVPVITFVKVPKTVTVGTPFPVSVNIISKNKIAFLNVWFEGVSRKMAPKVNNNLHYIKLIAKSPGKKVLKIYAVDVMRFSGKSYNTNLYACEKTRVEGDSGMIIQTKPPGKLGNVKSNYSLLAGDPPEFKLNNYLYCTGDYIDLKGKNFTGDLKVRIGSKQIKIERYTFKTLRFRTGGGTVNDFLYVRNNAGETKSKRQLKISGIPEIKNVIPADAGQKDVVEIRGKYIDSVDKAALKIKHPGIDKAYDLKIIGKPESGKIRLKMPDILNYPGDSYIHLNSRCGSAKKIKLNIKKNGVVFLTPELKRFYPISGAPGTIINVYVSDLSVPEKEKIEVSFNNLKGIVEDLEYHGKGEYKLRVSIPEDVTNIAGYGQKVRISAFGKSVISKDDFFLYGKPEIDNVEKALWSDKFVDIQGKNFVQYTTYVYFTGINENWIISEQVNNQGFNKVSAKIPWGIKKGHVKIRTYIGKEYQESISNLEFDPDPE